MTIIRLESWSCGVLGRSRVQNLSYLSNSRLRTPGVSLGVKASEGWEGFLLVLHFKCHGRKPVGIYPSALIMPSAYTRLNCGVE